MKFGAINGIPSKFNGSSGSVGGDQGINSDLSTPLNHLLYLADYKHFGEHSYAFQDKDIWVELIQSRAAMNDVDVVGVAVSEMINLGIDPLFAMSNIYGTGIEFRDYNSFEQVVADVENVRKILNHDICYSLVKNYKPYLNAIFSSDERAVELLSHDWFMEYVNSIDDANATNHKSDGFYYLKTMAVSADGFSNPVNNNKIATGTSGAKYINCNGDTIVLREPVNSYYSWNGYLLDYAHYASSEFTNQTFIVNKIVKSIIPQSATYGEINISGNESGYQVTPSATRSLNTTIVYKQLFA